MEFYADVASLQSAMADHRRAGRSIGFCPTMGALHQGHLSLIEASRKENDITICSIYVNPTQFNDPEDLQKYPRELDRDRDMLAEAGCDGLFFPSDEMMYPKPAVMAMQFGPLENVMEGVHRAGHFNGVGLVVAKLLHLVGPTRAYFGQKDLQQFAVIRQMVEDLMFPVDLVCVPIVRESDGLAMSSRNARLSPVARKTAAQLYAFLQEAREQLLQGRSVMSVGQWVRAQLGEHRDINLEYFEIVHSHTLQSISKMNSSEPTSLCIAAWVGGVRLIDNLTV
ncbi:MAG TPA: pantoate--beta-alanine ligase [Cytophagales bacterium]|nr:pantoate--beta-alanine ligase [Cytophagales bacterium]HAA21718.1 pantoate--beta-alanine ligase [Cytophagales bacterium]HAP61153.1 pantoate--beta-alanine ligase [Cytophagales bacterium]